MTAMSSKGEVDTRAKWRSPSTFALVITAFVASAGTLAANTSAPKFRITDLGGLLSEPALNASGQVTGTFQSHAILWRNDGTQPVYLGPFDSGGALIGQSDSTALNSSGQVVGYVLGSAVYAFLWKNDGTPMVNLGTLGGDYSQANDINDLGQVAGESQTGNGESHAFLWKNNGRPMLDLGTFGGKASTAAALNASGQVTGQSNLLGDAAAHAFIWKNNGAPMVDLGTLGGASSAGQALNDSGQVMGVSTTRSGDKHAFLWRNDGTPMIDLGTLGGPMSEPLAINNAGQIAGNAFTRKLSVSRHAFVWLNDGTPMRDLGTLQGGPSSGAVDINASSWVVGWSNIDKIKTRRAFLWMNNGQPMQDLTALIDPADPLQPYVVLTKAIAINDAGDILAEGNDSRDYYTHHYFLRGSSLALDPRSLAFGNQKVGTTSAAKSITVQNNSTFVVPITSIALTGSGAKQFSSTNNCGNSLLGKGSCTIKLTFKPTTKGAKSAVLNVNGGGGGLRSVALTGTGT